VSVAFHRGLTTELRVKLQMAGLRIEEIDAQRALAGLLTREVDARGNPINSNDNKRAIRSGAGAWIEKLVEEVLADRFKLCREWEERNPGQKPFPPMFAEVVLAEARDFDIEDPMATINKIIELAEGELFFG
jgi:hypothetical protein